MVTRRKNGKYAPEDMVPELPLERYLNTKVAAFEFAADSSNPLATAFDTGMEIEADIGDIEDFRGRKWALYGAVVSPIVLSSHPDALAADLSMKFQLRYPDTAGQMYGRGTRNVIAEGSVAFAFGTGGYLTAIPFPFPLYIPHPRPILIAPSLEIVCATSINNAEFASKSWSMELLYGWAEAHGGDLLAASQVRPTA